MRTDVQGEIASVTPLPGTERSVLRTILGYVALRHTPYGLYPAIFISLLSFFSIFETRIFNVARPNIQSSLHITLEQLIGVVVTVSILTTVAAIAIGWAADRRPRRWFIGVGAIIQGLGGGLASQAVDRTAFGGWVTTDTVGSQLSGVPLFSLVADWYPPDARGRIFALLRTLGTIGGLMAAVTVGGLVVWLGWRESWLIFAVLIGALGILAVVTLREPIRGYFEKREMGLDDAEARLEDEPLSFGESLRATWSIRTVRRLFWAFVILDIGTGTVSFWIPFLLAEVYGLNALQRSFVFLPGVVGTLIGGILGGGLLDYFGRRSPASILRMAAGFSIVGAAGDLFVSLAPPLPYLMAFAFVSGFGAGVIAPAFLKVTTDVLPPRVRTLGTQFLNLSSIPASILLTGFSVIQQDFGYSPAMLAGIPFTVIGSLVFVTAADFYDRDRRAQRVAVSAEKEYREERQRGDAKLLSCRSVDVDYDGVQVLFGVDFDVDAGEIVALLGTNGAGKSTLLRAISGVTEASGGAILFEGRDITHQPPHEIAARGVIHMPGGRGTFPGLSVRENLELGAWMLEDRADAQRRLAELYRIFPVLKARAGESAAALSGGEQQMLSLAQAFLSKPKLLLIDELSLGLAPAVVAQLLEIVRQINENGTAVVLVEQSVNVALTIAKRAVFLEKGEVKFSGETADLLRRPDILRAVYVKGTAALGGTTIVTEAARRSRAGELAGAKAVLAVQEVTKTYGGIRALDPVSFELREAEVLGLIGPNGSGKTTLLDCISGHVEPDSGRVIVGGVDVTSMPPSERARIGLVRRFQDARLYPALTVYETLLVALDRRLEVRFSGFAAFGLPNAWRAERRARARADRLLQLLSLTPYRDNLVRELSTGLRRILDLALVLAAEPKVLLLDEPSTGIAQAESEGLAPLLRRVRHETGCAILLVEHDMPLLTAVADEVIALADGQILLRGAPQDVLSDDRVIEAYLGASEAAIQRSGSLVS